MIENFLLLIYLLIIGPKLLFDRIWKGKKHPGILQRLGFRLPLLGKPLIWIHAVSVGEVKAALPLFTLLKESNPNATFLITTTTATGQVEAKRSLSKADAFGYLPIDFTWVVTRWVKRLNPEHFILVESDFWPNLIQALKKNGTKISLVSGKISERSTRRFRLFPLLANRLFSQFDHICVQNREHYQRFASLIKDQVRLSTTGNIKFDLEKEMDSDSLEKEAICISCTHKKEEEMILDALEGVKRSIFLAPRHPERFSEVADLLNSKQIPFSRYGEKRKAKVILVDQMGVLAECYNQSALAILGGSFVDDVGGHNVLEPCLYGCPVIFGPYMWGQTELAKRALKAQAGVQVEMKDLRKTVLQFFGSEEMRESMRLGAKKTAKEGRGAALRTFEVITNY